jgi:hypothetical protein
MKRPQEVNLSREDGEALRTRLASDALTADDRRVLGHVLEWYFWLVFTVQEARVSLKRLRPLLFGKSPRPPKGPPPDKPLGGGMGGGGAVSARRPGHGRRGVQAYSGAPRVECRHETLAVGQRWPACGRGRLYPVPPGAALRIDGNALLSASCYVLEKLRCSACGQVFTATLPQEAGEEKYSSRARAVVTVGRYYLGVPSYRLEGYQAMVGVPVSDATQWEQIEQVADCAYPIFEALKRLAAQGEVIYQDDTHVRVLTLLAENRQRRAQDSASQKRTGMHTTALVAVQGAHTICLYFSGRAHAGENLAALLAQRPPAPPF